MAAPVARDLDVLVGARPLAASPSDAAAVAPSAAELSLARPLLAKPGANEGRLAAPALLAALKDAEHALEPLVQTSEYGSYGYAYDIIVKAIKQAEGSTKP